MKIAILTRPDYRSPRVLADSLKLQLELHGVEVEIFYNLGFITRLVSLKDSKLSFHFWLSEKLSYLSKDAALIRILKKFDGIILCECTPAAFLKRMYNVEKLKRIINKPIGLYEVYYLGNAPTQIQFLKEENNSLLERFDFHLSVASTTEIKQSPSELFYPIGLYAQSWNLKPSVNEEIIAIVDFSQPGYERYRKVQIDALKKAGIQYVILQKGYNFREIRKIYQQGSIFFVQFPEAFGLPILECLCCGCQVFTPESSWPMSWRLNENPEVHGDGLLPDCFTVYHNEEQLVNELLMFKEKFDPVESPKKTFETFLKHYPDFYLGNESEIKKALEKIQSTNIKG